MTGCEERCEARIVDQVVKEPGIYFPLVTVGAERHEIYRWVPLPLWGRGVVGAGSNRAGQNIGIIVRVVLVRLRRSRTAQARVLRMRSTNQPSLIILYYKLSWFTSTWKRA